MDVSFESCKVRYGQPLILQGGMVSPLCLQILYLRTCLLKNLLVTPETVLVAPLWSFAHNAQSSENFELPNVQRRLNKMFCLPVSALVR